MHPDRRYTVLGTYVVVKQAPPWSKFLLERLIVPQPVLKFPRFRDPPPNFITMLTKARHWTVFWSRLIQSHTLFHPVCWMCMSISCYRRLGLQSGLFAFGPSLKLVYLKVGGGLVLRRGYVLEYLVVNRIVVKRVLLKKSGVSFTTGLRSRIFGCKSNRRKTSTV